MALLGKKRTNDLRVTHQGFNLTPTPTREGLCESLHPVWEYLDRIKNGRERFNRDMDANVFAQNARNVLQIPSDPKAYYKLVADLDATVLENPTTVATSLNNRAGNVTIDNNLKLLMLSLRLDPDTFMALKCFNLIGYTHTSLRT